MYEDILGCPAGGITTGVLWVETKDAAVKDYLVLNVNSLDVEKP